MEEILPGVWHWTAKHPVIGIDVHCHYLEDAGAAVDALLPEGGTDAFGDWAVQRFIGTVRHHRRDAAKLHEAFGTAVVLPREGEHDYEGWEVPYELYGDGDEVASGVKAINMGAICPDDYVLHIHAGRGALLFGDGLGQHNGELMFMPDQYMDDPPTVKAKTIERARELLDRDFDALLFAHTAPITSGGRDELERFVKAWN
jgi:glyoxylase-like metal-dependent hydrolase (beta-lactamase superfamily II)